MKKLHLGCGWRNFGDDWIHIDNGDYQHLNFKSSIDKLPMIENESIDLIYASHCIAYFDRSEIFDVLQEWKRVLKQGGILRLATPDFKAISRLYHNNKDFNLGNALGPLYGKMSMDKIMIYHKTTYDYDSLSSLLKSIGFKNIVLWDWRSVEHSRYDDHSQAYYPHMNKDNGVLISLNVECKK